VQKSTVGGILSIVAGALGVLGGLFLLLFGIFFQSIANEPDFWTSSGASTTMTHDQAIAFITILYSVIGVIGLVLGALAIVGGIMCLRRKHWGWALAGAIAGCLSFLPLGVGAVVLVAMGKSEFAGSASNVSPQPSV
jgi:hypothetical protein